jgi:transcriptional regulator with XRE-family HTH domain
MADEDADAGIARAGAAFADRRRELRIAQRELARLKVISGSSLIDFEKGRTWPRERTRATLEDIVRWPAGTIAAIRNGAPIPGVEPAPKPDDTEAPLIVSAVEVAMNTFTAAIANLPDDSDPRFPSYVSVLLADLRRLEVVAARAVRTSRGSPEVLKALSAIRRRYDDLMQRAAAAPGATVGQRLYAARRRTNLTAADAAAALGVPTELIAAVETGESADPSSEEWINALIAELNA